MVELAFTGAEYMHDHVAVVKQDPPGGRVALALAWSEVLVTPQLVDDLALNGFDLPFARTRADHEVVRDRRDRAEVQQEDVARLAVGGDIDNSLRER
jgi:hypothetical protein